MSGVTAAATGGNVPPTLELRSVRRCKATVRLGGVTHAFVAALREALLCDTPCMGFHSVGLDNAPESEVPQHARLQFGLVPLATDDIFAWEGATQAPPTGACVAAATFHAVGGKAGDCLTDKHLRWQAVDGHHPPARVWVAHPPGVEVYRMAVMGCGDVWSGQAHAVRGTGRMGVPWFCVPQVTWRCEVYVTFHVPLAHLSQAMQDTLATSCPAVVPLWRGAATGVRVPMWADAGFTTLLGSQMDGGAWREGGVATVHEPGVTAFEVVIETNGGVHAAHALATALVQLKRDAAVMRVA